MDTNIPASHNEFHHRDGWYFSRLSDGSVRMRLDPAANPTAGIAVHHIIAPNEWISIVAHVADGGSPESYTAATTVHGPFTPYVGPDEELIRAAR